jgi:Protein of unknown function (DUF3499)
MARSARCDVRRGAAVFVGSDETTVHDNRSVLARFVGSSCRSAARTSQARIVLGSRLRRHSATKNVSPVPPQHGGGRSGHGGASHDQTALRSSVRQVRSRRCSRAGCPYPATSTLTYAYRDSTAVLGPLANQVEPHCYDLCQSHAQTLSAPRGWEVIRLTVEQEPKPSTDDLLALADAVRDAGLSYDPPPGPIMDPPPRRGGMVELARRGHLTVLADPGAD